MTKTFDCLFLHPNRHYKGDAPSFLIMPMGLLSLASMLVDNGFEARIYHLGLEHVLNPQFQIEAFLKRNMAKVIAIDLQWTRHAFEAIKLAEACKQIQPTALVILGGLTASFFDVEILQNFPCIDAIIRGEAESPLLELVTAVTRKQQQITFPNITIRHGSSTKRNPIGWVEDEAGFNQRSFVDLNLLEHGNEYIKIMKPLPFNQSWAQKLMFPKLTGYHLNWLNYLRRGFLVTTRGCSFNCANCGGGKEAHNRISGRQEPIRKSTDSIVEEVIRWAEYGVRQLHIEPDPCQRYRKWYTTLFKKLREERVDIAADYYTRVLPDKEFGNDFTRTFDPYLSKLVFSPESGSERIRAINNFHHNFSNKALFKALEVLEAQGVTTELYFSVGNSGETREDFYLTLRMAEAVLNKHRNIVGPGCYPVDIEPCSPFFLAPEKFGLEVYRKSFMDFYKFEWKKSLGEGIEHPIGYMTKHMSETDMISLSRLFSSMLVKKAVDSGIEDDLEVKAG
jgi:radical SAM superfamily enzyme YgiQ (UPF0313 family)